MNDSFSNSSKSNSSKNGEDEMKFIYEVNAPIKPNKFQKWIREIKKKYKLSLIFDLVNLALSITFCALYIISTYDPSNFHKNTSYFWYSFVSIIYFLVDYIFNSLTNPIDNKYELFIYNTTEIITIFPFLIIRVVFGFHEDLTSTGHKLTAALVSIRIFRVEYLGKYIVIKDILY